MRFYRLFHLISIISLLLLSLFVSLPVSAQVDSNQVEVKLPTANLTPRRIESLQAVAHYYVNATTGNDLAGNGTIASPWRTISYAISQVTGPGVEIHIAPGLYNVALGESFPIRPPNGVSLIGEVRDTTIISGTTNQPVVELASSLTNILSNTVVSNFTLQNGSAGVRIFASGGVTVEPTISNIRTQANTHGVIIETGVYLSAGIANPRLIEVLAHDNTQTGFYIRPYYTNSSAAPLILQSASYNNGTQGIWIEGVGTGGLPGTAAPVISDTLIANNGSHGIYLTASYQGQANPRLERNRIEGNGGWGVYWTPGINGARVNANLYNNVIAHNQQGGLYWGAGGPAGTGGSFRLVNNTIAHNTAYGIYWHENATYASTRVTPFVINTLVWNPNADDLYASWSPGWTTSQIQYSNIEDGDFNLASGNFSADPMFADPARNDYHVSPDSPVINAGNTTQPDIPATDLDGDSRIFGASIDLGADEALPYNVSLAQTVQPDTVAPGEILTYTLTVANLGGTTAAGVSVTDQLPSEVTWGGYAQTNLGSVAVVSNLLTWRGTLSTSEVQTITYNATVNPGLPVGLKIPNTATVIGWGGVVTETTPVTITVGPSVLWSSSHQQVSSEQTAPGQRLTYTLYISNTGNLTANNVTVTDTLDSNVTLASASDGGAFNNEEVVWSGLAIPASTSISRTLVVTVNTPLIDGTFIVNKAQIGGEGYPPFELPSSNAVTLIYNPLTVDFTAAPLTGTIPLQVYFTNNSLNATSYYWDFGDGAYSTARNPVHSYTQARPYTVTLIASKATTSATFSRAGYITAYEVPIAGLTATNSSPTEVGDPTSFTASVTAGSNVVYNWTFGDGATGSGPVVTHTYPATGTYTAVVTASNSATTATATTTVTIIDNRIWYVSSTGNDTNSCLLPTTACRTISAAVGKASANDTIVLAPGRYIENVTISNKKLFLQGSGVDSAIVDGNKAGPVFNINSNANVTISHMSITNGNGGIYVNGSGTVLILNNSAINNNQATQNGGGLSISFGTVYVNNSMIRGNSAPNGGGIFIQPSNGDALLKVSNSTISYNTTNNTGAGNGGGIFSWRTVILLNSTVSYNSAYGDGGGIFNSGSSAFLTVSNSTISHNSANGNGGGIVNPSYSTTSLKNSILASQNSGNNCENGGTLNSLGYNLDSDGSCGLSTLGDLSNLDPLLGPLQNNGGSTPTQALLPHSPVIDIIPSNRCTDYSGTAITTDQRGQARPLDGDGDNYAACDMGAYEATGDESSLVLQVAPTTLSFNATQGGSNPTGQTFSIGNVGLGTLNWTASENLSWLSLGKISGTAPATVIVSVDTNGLAAGTYHGQITVTSEGAQGSPQLINVTLTLNPAPPSVLTLSAEAGHSSIELNWNPINDPNVIAYRISRGEISNTLTTIATISDTVYIDSDPTLTTGATYCYQVAALRANNTVAATSNTACATFGQVALWIPDIWAAPGQTAIVPVNIRNATGLRIAASDIWLDFDRTVLEPLSIQATPLSAGYQWAYSLSDFSGYSRAKISVIAGSAPMLRGDGSLFWLKVRVVGSSGVETPLNLREFITGVGGSTIYTPADLFNPIPLNLQDGTFYVANTYVLGDLNGNGVIEAVDAYIALQIASHKLNPTAQQLQAGDVNGNGRVDAADASMIFYYAVHGNWPPLPVTGSSLQAAAGPVQLDLDDVNGQPGQVVATTLRAQNLSGWAGGKFVIAYDLSVVESITNVAVTGLATGFAIQFHDDGAGLLYIALADDIPVSGSGALATISLRIASNATDGSRAPLTLAEAELNDVSGRDFVTSALQQIIQRDSGEVRIGAGESNQVYLPIIIK